MDGIWCKNFKIKARDTIYIISRVFKYGHLTTLQVQKEESVCKGYLKIEMVDIKKNCKKKLLSLKKEKRDIYNTTYEYEASYY